MIDKMVVQSTYYGMNTVMNHKAFGKHAKRALRAVRRESIRLEKKFSRFIPRSEISNINKSAGIKCRKISRETYEVLSRAVQFSKCSQGLFDITIAPLVALWSNSKNTCSPPKDEDIKRILSLVDYTDLLLDSNKNTVKLQKIGQSIDLGGIGKGFAGDKFLEVFKKCGVTSAFINIGGNVVVLGTKPDASLWNVGIQHPRQENDLIGILSIANKAVVTSGDYQRYFIGNDDKRYHHILNPSTGYPAESGLVGVTVVADNSMDADALSTILFIAGMKKGIEILKQFSGTEAIFVDKELKVHITAGLTKCFQATEGISVHVLE